MQTKSDIPARGALLLLALLSAAACTVESPLFKASSTSAKMLSYAKSAQELYEKGVKKLTAHNCVDAIKYFNEVKDRFPFEKTYVRLSDLRIADCHFDTEDYAQASEKYKEFTQLYPSHEEVDYASYRRALSTFKRIPSQLFVLPPVYERDQSFVKEAAREFKEFLDSFPSSDWVPEATKSYVQCLNMVARHELYVAKYYFKKSKFKGAVHRCKRVIEKLKESDLVPEAVLLWGECCLKMGQKDQAAAIFASLVKDHPASFQAKQAKDYLEVLGAGATAAAPKP